MKGEELAQQAYNIIDALGRVESGETYSTLLNRLRVIVGKLVRDDQGEELPDSLRSARRDADAISGVLARMSDHFEEVGYTHKRYSFHSEVRCLGFYDVERNHLGKPFRWAGKERSASVFIDDPASTLRWIALLVAPVQGFNLDSGSLKLTVNGVARPFVTVPCRTKMFILVDVVNKWSVVELVLSVETPVSANGRHLSVSVHEIVELHACSN